LGTKSEILYGLSYATIFGIEAKPSNISNYSLTQSVEAAEEADDSLLKLLARRIDCAAVICVGYFPQGNRWVS
jgi:hypothetical protein